VARELLRSQRLHAALADFYAPGLAAHTFVDRAFALTSQLLPSSLNSHGVIDQKTGVLTANFDCTPPGLADAFAAFGRHMAKYAPFRFDPSVNSGKPFSARDFYSRPAFHDLDIYQEVYRPMGLDDHCFLHVPTGSDSIVFVGFLRDGRPFDRGEKELLGLVQPHLSNGRKLALAMTAAEDTPLSPELFAGVGFTPRESDVLYWLTRGKLNEEIARILHLRADSVSRHLQTIYEKMGVEHRVAATIRALDLARKLHARSLALQGGEVSLTVRTRADARARP
jgi:DNA-binding CsgD family transcriptional regulator